MQPGQCWRTSCGTASWRQLLGLALSVSCATVCSHAAEEDAFDHSEGRRASVPPSESESDALMPGGWTSLRPSTSPASWDLNAPVNCQVTGWSAYSKCSKEQNGIQTRARAVKVSCSTGKCKAHTVSARFTRNSAVLVAHH